jgi:hypothetical protein
MMIKVSKGRTRFAAASPLMSGPLLTEVLAIGVRLRDVLHVTPALLSSAVMGEARGES